MDKQTIVEAYKARCASLREEQASLEKDKAALAVEVSQIEKTDTSENAEYQNARDKQRAIETRLMQLGKKIAAFEYEVVPRLDDKDSLIQEGSFVHYSIEGRSNIPMKDFYVLLVKQGQDDIMSHLLSSATNVGRALIGARKGTTVSVPTQAGLIELSIKEDW